MKSHQKSRNNITSVLNGKLAVQCGVARDVTARRHLSSSTCLLTSTSQPLQSLPPLLFPALPTINIAIIVACGIASVTSQVSSIARTCASISSINSCALSRSSCVTRCLSMRVTSLTPTAARTVLKWLLPLRSCSISTRGFPEAEMKTCDVRVDVIAAVGLFNCTNTSRLRFPVWEVGATISTIECPQGRSL